MSLKKFNKAEIQSLNKQYRVQLINSLTGYKSANLVGTVDNNGVENLAIFSSVTHVGSAPALLSLNFRPDKTPRHTFENIMETEFFTVNHVSKYILDKAHQTSAKYPKGVSEFSEVDLASEYIDDFKAPFVKESEIKIGLRLVEHHHIKYNGTELVIAEIEKIYLPDTVLLDDGSLDYTQLDTIALTGLDCYYKTQFVVKKEYAHKPLKGKTF